MIYSLLAALGLSLLLVVQFGPSAYIGSESEIAPAHEADRSVSAAAAPAAADTVAAAAMTAARAAESWGDWRQVERILDGRPWLDTHDNAAGWALLGRARLELGKLQPARDAMSRYITLAVRPDPVEDGIIRLRLASAHARLEDPAAALREYDEAAARLPRITDWIAINAAAVAAETGDSAGVRRLLAGLDADLTGEWGWNARVQSRAQAGDTAGAAAAAESAARTVTAAGRRADAWLSSARYRRALGDVAGARTALRNSMNASAGSTAARDAARMLLDLGAPTPNDRLLAGRTLIRHGDFQRGAAELNSYLAGNHGTAAEREALRLELGNSLFRGRQYAEAERILLQLSTDATSRARRAEALFVAGRSQYRDGRIAQGRQTFARVSDSYADVESGAIAAYFAADLLHDDNDIAAASALYRKVVDSNRGVEEVGLAAMRLGGIAFGRGDFQGALREFEEYRRRFPSGRVYQQATFWAGRSLERMGNAAAARERYVETIRHDPLSYYAAQAADAIGARFFQLSLAAPPPRLFVTEVDGAFERIDLLTRLGWNAPANWEIERGRSRFSESDAALYTFAEALGSRGFTSTAIAIGWELRRRHAWNNRLLRIIYPFPYRDLVESEARRRNVDPFLAAGLIRQESMFNATALSPVGAIGLMQVMPETGRAIAAANGIVEFSPAMLYNPEVNVRLGMAYLADQLRTYGSRVDAVLAAYNAGPHRVERWRTLPEWSDQALFAERIPFAETRGYVKIVQTNARIYQALYGP
jgi:soluble lytic murein transglycosylase